MSETIHDHKHVVRNLRRSSRRASHAVRFLSEGGGILAAYTGCGRRLGPGEFEGLPRDAEITCNRCRMVRASETAPCGTYAAAQRHRKRGEVIDDECAEARNAYQREYRARDEVVARGDRERDQRLSVCRSRARARLAEAHPEEFNNLLAAELARYDEERR